MNQLYIGGMMRCCCETFDDYNRSQDINKLTEIPCKYCSSVIVKRPDGDWEWEGYEKAKLREKE